MKYVALLMLIITAPGYASFKVTILSNDKPDIQKVDAPDNKPQIKLREDNNKSSTDNVDSTVNAAIPIPVNKPVIEHQVKPANIHQPESMPAQSKADKQAGQMEATESAEPVFIADAPKDRPLNKYDELKELKEAKIRESVVADNQPVQVNSLWDEAEPIKPLFELTQGQTFAGVLEKWADSERHKVVFDLGIWDRVQELKMTVNYLFTTELKSSVEQFLNLLNETSNLKSNDVTLHACFFKNKYIKVTTNSKCGV